MTILQLYRPDRPKKQAGSDERIGGWGHGLIEGKTIRAVPQGRPASRSFLTFT
jgi:hypothetical protein